MSRPFARALALLLCALALGVGGAARAQDYERPHHWLLELRVSTVYYPDADVGAQSIPFTTAGGSGAAGPPFHDTYGSKHRMLTELEIDRELWREFGTLSIGLAGGYSEFYGNGFRQGPTGGLVQSSAQSSFHVVPIRTLATYRFDYYVPQHIPIVPFVRAGFDWVLYWNAMQDGQVSFVPAAPGRPSTQSFSLTTGVEGSVGIALLLDVFDPDSARAFFEDLGIAHTYVLAEYTDQIIENGPGNIVHAIRTLGQAPIPSVNLSARYFDFGLGFEF